MTKTTTDGGTAMRAAPPTTDTRSRSGLCSVTFREFTAEAVLAAAVAAGLEVIEWGGDAHVPAGDLERAAAVAAATRAAGLSVASYGSYLCLGSTDAAGRSDVLETAKALTANRIRVWAGSLGSAEATPDLLERMVTDGRALADGAADLGLSIGLEFHGGTFTDTARSTLELLDRIDRPGVFGTYWQPPQGLSDDDAFAGLALVAEQVVAIHAFSWWPSQQRHCLAFRASLWSRVAAYFADRVVAKDFLLEFVVDDDPNQLVADALTLRSILHPATNPHDHPIGRRTATNR